MDHRPACTLAGNYPIQLRPVGTAKACRHSREDQTCTSVAGVDHRLACRVVVAQGRQQMCTAVAGMDHRPACTLKGSRSSPISSRGRTKAALMLSMRIFAELHHWLLSAVAFRCHSVACLSLRAPLRCGVARRHPDDGSHAPGGVPLPICDIRIPVPIIGFSRLPPQSFREMDGPGNFEKF